MISRRAFLGSTAAIPLVVGGCANFGTKVDQAVQGIIEYGQAIYNGLRSAWGQLQALPSIQALSTDAKTTIATGAKAVGDSLAALAGVASAAQAQPIVAKLVTYAQSVLAVLASVTGLPAAVTVLIGAAQVVLPVLQSLVGLAVATVAQVQAAAQAKATLNAAPAT